MKKNETTSNTAETAVLDKNELNLTGDVSARVETQSGDQNGTSPAAASFIDGGVIPGSSFNDVKAATAPAVVNPVGETAATVET